MIPARSLNEMFSQDLGALVVGAPAVAVRPMSVRATYPLPPRMRVYLFTATTHPGERESAVFKIQLILPGHDRVTGATAKLDVSDGHLPVFGGFVPSLEVWILWDAPLYNTDDGIAFSRNIQCSAKTVFGALASPSGLCFGHKQRRKTIYGGFRETIIAARREHLADALAQRFTLTLDRLSGST